jgi:hypothetical protein
VAARRTLSSSVDIGPSITPWWDRRELKRPQQYGERVRHASSAALDELEPFLDELRRVPELVERKRGVFYRRSRAFLHFHEDVSGLHADVRLTDRFERFRVQTLAERGRLLDLIRSVEG